MDYVAAMRAFVQAVDLGSFSRAAAKGGVKVSTVSRHVGALESDLGVALLNRSTRGLALTEAGAAFYERSVEVLAGLDAARAETALLNATPRGTLRLNIPAAFGRRHVIPHLAAFRSAHPLVRLDVTLTDATVNLIESGTDVAVRIGALADSALVARRLASQRRMLVASPRYLAGRGTPEAPNALAGHECLTLALQPKDAWYATRAAAGSAREIPVRGGFRANDSEALLQAVLDGMGVALLPTWLLGEALRAGTLLPLLPDWTWSIAPGPERAIWGVYAPKQTVSPKVRAFLDFIAERFGRPPYWDRDRPAGPDVA